MSQLPQLRASFMEAAERQTTLAARGGRRPRRQLRTALAIALVALLLAAAAVAATGVLRTGPAVRPSERLTPSAGFGVPAPGGSHLLGVSFADPAGGPRWGLRVVHTTRDLVCLQLGRLDRGSLGVLGLDGAFHNDGLFHPLPADVIGRQLGAATCQPEAVRVSLEVSGIPESGLMPAGGDLGAVSQDRWVSYGLLGPHALSVTYSYDGAAHTVPVERGTGAYVIVLPGSRPGPRDNGITSGGSSGASQPGRSPLPNPEGALTAITYQLGDSTCQDSAAASTPDACPRPHAAPARDRLLEPSLHLNRPVTVRVHRAAVPGGYSAVLRFKAPYTVPNALSGYSIAAPTPCHEGTGIDPIDRDVRAGTTVTVPLEAVFANTCGPTVTLEVLYSKRQATPTAGAGSVLVGRVVVRRPR
jgi:hypothetical protein